MDLGKFVCSDCDCRNCLPAVDLHLVCSWFAGCLTCSTLQALLFIAASALLLILTRPLVRKFTNFASRDTNLRLDLGKFGTVVQTVDAEKGTGRVRVDDIDWIAVSQPNLVIPKGTTVQVQAIDGTKLFVTPVPQTTEPVVESTNAASSSEHTS